VPDVDPGYVPNMGMACFIDRTGKIQCFYNYRPCECNSQVARKMSSVENTDS
jgi:hypothetical protein